MTVRTVMYRQRIRSIPGMKSDLLDFIVSRVGLRLLGGGDIVTAEKKDQGLFIQKLSLVLNAIRLIVELLR